jgi:hypothetical protein
MLLLSPLKRLPSLGTASPAITAAQKPFEKVILSSGYYHPTTQTFEMS